MYRRQSRTHPFDLDWLDHTVNSGLGAARQGIRAATRAVHGRRRSRTPSLLLLVIAGLVALALAKVMSAANARDRSTAEKVVLGLVLVAVAAIALSLRKSGRRYRW